MKPSYDLSFSEYREASRALTQANELASNALIIIIGIILGFIANRLYLNKITRLKNKNKDYRCSGTNILAAILIPLAIMFVLVKIRLAL